MAKAVAHAPYLLGGRQFGPRRRGGIEAAETGAGSPNSLDQGSLGYEFEFHLALQIAARMLAIPAVVEMANMPALSNAFRIAFACNGPRSALCGPATWPRNHPRRPDRRTEHAAWKSRSSQR